MLNKINKSLVVLDKATCHESPFFLNALTNINENSKYKVIPGGLTGNNLAKKCNLFHF
jgi:hypothetical protein